jgi:indolepyruvate decarboxylase
MDESLPQYMGLYGGIWSSAPAVCAAVEAADLILDVGGLFTHELNTGMWTSVPKAERILSIQDNFVRAGDKVFLNVAIDDVLAALAAKVPARKGNSPVKVEQLPMTGKGADTLTTDAFYPRLQRALRAGDTLVIETGSCMTRLNRMLLPAGVSAEGQGLWGSIGWATPACLGVDMAKTSGRTVMVTGDGSHQLTLNELAVMGRYKAKPIIFVLNNGLYGVEDVISERGHPYDDLARVNYHLLPQAFGCNGWLALKVGTVAELEAAFEKIAAHDGAAYIEVMIPEAESQPLSDEIIDNAYKVKTPAAG